MAWKGPGNNHIYCSGTPIAAVTGPYHRPVLCWVASTALQSFETSFHQDFNGDGAIGAGAGTALSTSFDGQQTIGRPSTCIMIFFTF